MSNTKCAYFMCNNNAGTKSMFRFPSNDKRRLSKWLNNCGNLALYSVQPEKLRHRYICIDHFDAKYLSKVDGKRKRIRKTAIPKHYRGDSYGKKKQEMDSTCMGQAPGIDLVPDMDHTHYWPDSSKPRVYKNKKSNNSIEENGISKMKNFYARSWRTQKKSHEKNNKNEPRVQDFGNDCSNCQKRITGFRYTCVQCVDVELCCACEARQAHAQHYVLRIPGPRPRSEVEEVLSRVREAVGMVLFPRSTPEIDEPEIIKPEILDEETDPLNENPNCRPHNLNMLEQPLIDIPLLRESVEPEHTDIRYEAPLIKQEVEEVTEVAEAEEVEGVAKAEEVTEAKEVAQAEEVADAEEVAETEEVAEAEEVTSENTENTVVGYQLGGSPNPPAVKRRRVCPAHPAHSANPANPARSAHPDHASSASFQVMTHVPRTTSTALLKANKADMKKS